MLSTLGPFCPIKQPLFLLTHSFQCVVKPRHVKPGRRPSGGDVCADCHVRARVIRKVALRSDSGTGTVLDISWISLETQEIQKWHVLAACTFHFPNRKTPNGRFTPLTTNVDTVI